MKKTIRVHKKRSAAPAASQVKTILPVAADNPIADDAVRLEPEMPSVFNELDELEQATIQSNALHLLIFDCMKDDDGAGYSQEIKCGIIELMSETHKRLGKVAENLRARLSRRVAGEVAS